jgi:hypothetical protein
MKTFNVIRTPRIKFNLFLMAKESGKRQFDDSSFNSLNGPPKALLPNLSLKYNTKI